MGSGPYIEGRKWLALTYLEASGTPEAAIGLARFADLAVSIPHRGRKLRNDRHAIINKPPGGKHPYYEHFAHTRGPEILGGATELGKTRRH